MALYQQLPFFNPSVPFTRLFQGGLQAGTSITVCGRVWSDAERFQVDLKYGSDIALHFNPRYDGGSGYVMHNTYQRGRWGSEERKYETPFPRGQIFALQILVTLSSYQISTNGKPFSEYKHRMPFSWVDRIHPHQPLGSFTVPYKSIIHGGLQLGKVIIIQGFINPQANRVVISLRHKTGIAFVYSADFDKNLVLRNTHGDGKWGEEEQSELMPIKKGQPLQKLIYCWETYGYQANQHREMNPEPTEPNKAPDLNELRIMLLGVCGAGKSQTANAILGREAFKESRTRESEKNRGRVEDRNISIIDSPGFFNTHLTDEELRKQMMKSLYLSDPGPHVFLLVINLKTFREEQRNIVQQIQENFGEEAFLFTMVLFIGREKVSKREFIQIIESEETQKILNYFEGRFHVINSKDECDLNQIIKLLTGIDEMVRNNGGQNYSNEIYLKNQRKLKEQKERFKNDEKRLQQEEERMKHEPVRKGLEERDGINQEEEIKTKSKESRIKADNEKKQEDVSEDKTQYLRVEGDLRIVLLGKTGSGKSSIGNTILGRDVFKVSFSSESTTQLCEKQEGNAEDRNISVIDTPGLFHTSMTENHLKAEIDKSLQMSAPGPHVFLLVIRLGRFTEEEQNTVKWIVKNLGEDVKRFTIVLFNVTDKLIKPLEEILQETQELKKLVDECEGRYHVFNNVENND